jgi:hypothetical protein
MTAATSEKLAQALDACGLAELAIRARRDEFHDFLSPHALPELLLEQALRLARNNCPDHKRRVLIEQVRQAVINGHFDASKAESDAWAESEEGQEAYRDLLRDLP